MHLFARLVVSDAILTGDSGGLIFWEANCALEGLLLWIGITHGGRPFESGEGTLYNLAY